MNILILTKENNQGGLVTHVINLANTLTEKGNCVIVLGPLVNGKKGRFSELQCKYVPLNLMKTEPIEFLKNLRCIQTILLKENIEIVHSHNRITSIYAQLACAGKQIPFVWTLHLNHIPSDFIHRIMTFHGSKAIVVSTDLISFCEEKLKIPRNEITLGYNGIYENRYYVYTDKEKTELRKKWGIDKQDLVFAVLSRLHPVKGHDRVIMAVEKLKRKVPDARIKILFTGKDDGGEYKSELIRKILKSGLKNSFIFTGYTNPVDVLNVSHLFILPSYNEGFPISIIESFFLHVPVIRTRTGGFEDVKNFCYLMKNEDDLAVFMEKFIKGEINTENRVNQAYQFAMENLTCDKMAEKVLCVYKEALNKKKMRKRR